MAKTDSTHRQRLLNPRVMAFAGRQRFSNDRAGRGLTGNLLRALHGQGEQSFLATYCSVAKRVGLDVRRVERSGLDRPREILAGLLDNTERDPASARLVLIEAVAGGPAVRAEHEQLLDGIEAAVNRYLDGAARLETPA